MDLREMGCDAGDRIDLAEERIHCRAYVRAVIYCSDIFLLVA